VLAGDVKRATEDVFGYYFLDISMSDPYPAASMFLASTLKNKGRAQMTNLA